MVANPEDRFSHDKTCITLLYFFYYFCAFFYKIICSITGDNITYTNWWHDRKGNFFSHHTEDCVLFVPYSPYNGKWDDVPCGTTNALGTDQGQINPFICQFCKLLTWT